MSQYSEIIGSFIRVGTFPLEADYIFSSLEKLKAYEENPDNKAIFHDGLLKVVQNEDNTLSLYWYEGGEFKELLKRRSLEEIKETIKANKDDIKLIAGTTNDNIESYLKTLPYENLTELANALHSFLTDIDESGINTFAELQKFLEGYSHTHNLQQVLEDLYNKIQGNPVPNEGFKTFRDIQEFITVLAEATKNRYENLQSEINQTQTGVGLDSDGSFSPDQETTYLKNATSVMNALRTLDSLINQAINNCNIQSKATDSVNVDILKEANKTTISAQVKISSELGNDIQVKNDGLYHTIDSEYENGILTIKVNGNVRQQHILGLSSLVENAYYDADQESIIIIFKLISGETQKISIPVALLITEWQVSNLYPSITLNKVRNIQGPDTLTADVNVSSVNNNILEKKVDGLAVIGISDNIDYKGQTLTNALTTVATNANDANARITNITGIVGNTWQANPAGTYSKNSTDIANAIYLLDKTLANKADSIHALEQELASVKSELDTYDWYEG